MTYFSTDLLNWAQEGKKSLKLQGKFKKIATKARRRAEATEAMSEHPRKALAEIESNLTEARDDVAIARANLVTVRADPALEKKKRGGSGNSQEEVDRSEEGGGGCCREI